jgi:signal transduction histidine kinase
MFFWSLVILVEVLLYIFAIYFIDVFNEKKDISFKKKLLLFIILLPVLLTLPTSLNLSGLYINSCNAEEGFIAKYYTYIVEIFSALWIIYYSVKSYRRTNDFIKRKKIMISTLGILFFLLALSSGNLIGSFTEQWDYSQFGLFVMPILIGALAYLIVKYNAFNVKLMATQVLIWGLVILIGSQFFFIKITTNFILNGVTFVGIIIFGQFLIKSVRKEVEQRELLESLTSKLEQSNSNLGEANEKLKGLDKLKTEFVSLASHQLRSPLTAIKGYTSMLLEGDYGDINPEAKDKIDRIMESSNNLTLVVEDLLNVAKIEQGGMKYIMVKFDFGELIEDTVKDLSITAEKKGLKLIFNLPEDKKYFVNGDKEKIRQIIINLIDNSIKYTTNGSIEVSMNSKDNKIIMVIKDTGVGIEKGKEETLFDKFTRGEGSKLNTSGSGLGLYLVREIAKAHGGRVWAESEGLGKGSTFFVEIAEAKDN